MRKYLLWSVLMTWSIQLFAASVRVRSDIDLVVTGTTSTTIPMNADKSSGEGTADSAPFKVYFPINNTTGSINSHVYFINTVSSVFDVTNTAHIASIPLRVNAGTGTTYLWVAVRDTTNSNTYKPIKRYVDVVPASGQSDLYFSFSPADICLALPTTCTSLVPTSTAETEQSFIVYFFLSTQASYGASDTIDPGALNTGIYFQMYMSNRVYSDADLRITIGNTKIGDKRLILPYTASNTLSTSTAKAVRVYQHNSAPGSVNSPIASYSGTLLSTNYTYSQNSEITVADLANGTPYIFSLVFLDKYNFVTTLSAPVTATPLEIQELLKKNSCFLLTAGFGEDHYIINYFRHFRDTVLVNSFLGRKFIQVYYGTAPKYALIIYQHDYVRGMIRGMAYALYFVFNYIYLILLGALSTSVLILYRRRLKNLKIG